MTQKFISVYLTIKKMPQSSHGYLSAISDHIKN